MSGVKFLCSDGCGQIVSYFCVKKHKWFCSKKRRSCPVIRAKLSECLKAAYRKGRRVAFIRSKFSKGEIFTKKSPALASRIIRILRSEGRGTICEECNNSAIWNNKPLVLELHHKNGDSKDHRRENLMFLCPNCHSQTESFRRKVKNL